MQLWSSAALLSRDTVSVAIYPARKCRGADEAHARRWRRVGVQTCVMHVRVCACVCVRACGYGCAWGYLDAEGVGGALRQYALALALLLLLRDRSLAASPPPVAAAKTRRRCHAVLRCLALVLYDLRVSAREAHGGCACTRGAQRWGQAQF